ncbi:olfactory receptor 52E2-like [Pelodiscus sinensis]|uniref:olfactory receptor 52E2-like n=1 Tax=Pelodiscus sinensis TaxID=13735 RepID=UPI003F6C3A31
MDANTTVFTNPSTFILLGIPGLEVAHVWISIPFCTMYIIVILGNCSILFIVKREPSLHEPVYYFLCMLAVTDLIGLVILLRGSILALPYPMLARQRPYCKTNIIRQTQCENMPMLKLACADTRISSYYGLFVLSCRMGLDVFLITLSYTQILRAIFRLPTKEARLKTFGTCGSHISVILAFYIPTLFGSLISRLISTPPHFLVLIANIYFLVPPMLNPIIYGNFPVTIALDPENFQKLCGQLVCQRKRSASELNRFSTTP